MLGAWNVEKNQIFYFYHLKLYISHYIKSIQKYFPPKNRKVVLKKKILINCRKEAKNAEITEQKIAKLLILIFEKVNWHSTCNI